MSIPPLNQDNSPKTLKAFGRAVIIGLGGTGQKALLEIKRNFQNNCGKVPPSIRLLSFDTDQAERGINDVHGKPVKLTEDEYCRLRVSLVRSAIRSPYVTDWWISYDPINSTAVTDGAGGIREMGRLSLFSCIDQVQRRIETVYNEMKSYGSAEAMEREGFQLLDGSEQVIVIGSLSGGTGGGLFFDISVLCHALGGSSFRYMAYVMMPWVYRNLANTAYENTYAGLTELNQLAELSVEKPLRIRYSETLECTLEECPYHIVNLVDGLCDNGERITSASELAGFIGESVYHLTGALGVHARSVYDNIMTRKRELDGTNWKGCKALYSAIGVANIRYPAPEIHRAVSCHRTAEILDLVRSEILEQEAQNPPTTEDDPVLAFIEQNHLKPTRDALLQRLLPDGAVDMVYIDDELDSIATRQELIETVEDQAGRAAEKAKAAIEKARSAMVNEVRKKIGQLLDQHASNSVEICESLSESFRAIKEKLVQLSEVSADESNAARDRRERAEGHLPAENSFLARLTGFRSKARAFSETSNEVLEVTCSAEAVRQAMEVIDELATAVQTHREEKGLAQEASVSLADRIKAIAHRYRSEAIDYLPGRGMARKRFDYILGVDDNSSDDATSVRYWTDDSVPKADAMWREARSRTDIGASAVAEIGPSDYAARLFDFVSRECRGILSLSAMEVLRANREKANQEGLEDPTHGLIQRALARSTLLLPLRQEELVQEPRSIRNILVIGIGSTDEDARNRPRKIEENLELLLATVPDDVREHTKVAHTSEPYSITVTHYKAIFPLHAIQGIEDLRHAYDDRVLPPSHIDRNSLFALSDPLPQDDTHHIALKLLTLAMLKCVGLIEHVHLRSGGSFFQAAPEIKSFCLQGYGDDQNLPGKSGKFYSLVEEISRKHFNDLRQGIENELKRRTTAPDFLTAFFAEAEQLEVAFRARVDNVATGLRKEVILLQDESQGRSIKGLFNKTVTGRYYLRQANFLREILRRREYLESKIAEGENLVDLLLARHEGFAI